MDTRIRDLRDNLRPGSRWAELIATGVLHPPAETGDPFEDWPDIRLAPGTAAELIDSDRGAPYPWSPGTPRKAAAAER